MKLYKQIPNLLTLTNLLLGCIGIVYAFDERYFVLGKNADGIYQTFEVSNRLFTCGFCIFLAAVIDFFDGFVARALNAQTEMGKQLDSLADMVTFGVLPGVIYYQLLERAYFLEAGSLFTSKLWILPAFLISLAACWRLAKFNIDTRQTTSFLGLPSPANAIFAASLPLIYITNAFGLGEWIINKYVLYCLVILFSYLMVCELPMFSLKVKGMKWKGNELVYIFTLLSVAIIVWFKWAGIAVVILLYIIVSIVKSFMPKSEAISS
jgi:CDP-diacylglycerol--serine O-phosphatidyltransferase